MSACLRRAVQRRGREGGWRCGEVEEEEVEEDGMIESDSSLTLDSAHWPGGRTDAAGLVKKAAMI